MDTVLLLTIS